MTITETQPTNRAKLERATSLVAELLKGRRRKDAGPHTAEALGRALAATMPKSEHGRLLFRTLRSVQADAGAVPRAEDEQAVWWLACRGQTPSPAAVAERIKAAESARRTAETARAAIERIAGQDGPRAAAHVAEVIARTGAGPTWRELGAALGWPRVPYDVRGLAVTRLIQAGWLDSGTEPRSLRPGPKTSPGGDQR